ncbi:MAG: flagellar hook-basal body complex protein, partial [Halanaerobacter sp.]
MLRSMYSGVSGMKAHMDKMDIVSNNISNVNTTGYKNSRATFKTMFSQMIQGATAPQGGRGGTNPQQIGLGTTLGSIDKDMGQGSLQSTGRNSDLAVEGSGFFVVNNGNSRRYTKAGSLSKDKDGYLVNSSTGYRVKGWQADENGEVDTNGELEDMTFKESMPAQATDEVSYAGNLNASAEEDETWSTSFESFDSQGTEHAVDL